MLLKKKFTAVICDMDGTLIDTEPIYYELNTELYEKLNIQHTPDLLASLRGISSKLKWSKLKSEFGLEQSVDELMSTSKLMKFEFLQAAELTPIDGIRSLLTELKENELTIGLATSATRLILDLLLSKMEIVDYFDFTISGDEIANGKPNPDIFLKAAKEMRVHYSDCVVLEDSQNGVEAAQKAGMFCVAHQSSESDQNLSSADLIVEDYSKENRVKILNLLKG